MTFKSGWCFWLLLVQDTSGDAVTAKADRYLKVWKRFQYDLTRRECGTRAKRFQQDGTTNFYCDFWLRELFDDRGINKATIMIWPPRSPDLNLSKRFLARLPSGLGVQKLLTEQKQHVPAQRLCNGWGS